MSEHRTAVLWLGIGLAVILGGGAAAAGRARPAIPSVHQRISCEDMRRHPAYTAAEARALPRLAKHFPRQLHVSARKVRRLVLRVLRIFVAWAFGA